ncbi:TOMM precursor leader peptide-binding protein [Actinokineospora sp. G85]|uniref:TOMM precursor leader peptide-binding protein n=1 Tax=Actinokineospora sp. G85 TaxID=3406626 RepID=UPI003C79235E
MRAPPRTPPHPPLRRPRLRPGLPLLRRRGGEVQIGLEPGLATVVDGVPPAVLDALGDLAGAHTAAGLLRRAGRHRAEMAELLAGLAGRGLLEDAAGPVPPPELAADAAHAATRQSAGLATRAAAGVLVRGDGRIAVAVARLLAESGVGHVRVEARGRVEPADLGTGLRRRDIGLPRAEAARGVVARAGDGVRTHGFHGRSPDLVVLADAPVPDPAVLACLRAPHLPVSAAQGVGVVGPLVLPGRTACLRCLDLHRTAGDACWPVVAAQVAGRAVPADLAAVHAAAALAVAQALAALRGPTGAGGVALRVDPAAGTLTRQAWPPHPECGCGAGRAIGG